jgi:hypothetical protein
MFFLSVSPECSRVLDCFGELADEIVLVIPNIMFVLMVPSLAWTRVGFGGFLGRGFSWEGMLLDEAFLPIGSLRAMVGGVSP